ncbi:MAG: hypothetical protein LBG88_02330 [Christensenellaceae bacterium]|nr:hypothetical protein [Christensenellaceae bacterium]
MVNVNFNARLIGYSRLDVENYLKCLRKVGSLSRIFSDSDTPIIVSRATEKLYCDCFNADNLARADVSVDARLGKTGIGIKTFIGSAQLQKIAEFNNSQKLYRDFNAFDKIKKIAGMRNSRLSFTLKAFDLDNLIYHCIVRNEEGFWLFEEQMQLISIDKIRITRESDNAIFFEDGLSEYKFDMTKSTLYKRFRAQSYFAFVKVEIAENPMEMLRDDIYTNQEAISFPEEILVPLYSQTASGEKVVQPKSGLNQWHAKARLNTKTGKSTPRNFAEVYIPWNEPLRSDYENFFPARDTSFNVELPNGETMSMKVCQEASKTNPGIGKALMSNPNKALGKWLLRDVLDIPEGELLTYDKLLEIGVDSVAFYKVRVGEYKLDFRSVGEFEKFISKTSDQ